MIRLSRRPTLPKSRGVALSLVLCLCGIAPTVAWSQGLPGTFTQVIETVQPKIVKVYGAGGFQGLESYQSGFLISPTGHIATVWSYVLDTNQITIILDDGRRYQAKLLGADPRLDLAVLKIEAEGLPYFDLEASAAADIGSRVLAFTNLYGVATGDESASVLHGVVTARSQLQARRGSFETPYNGPVYVVDAMVNNPGSAGGALTDAEGRLLGMVGKELRNRLNHTWLNYAMPVSALQERIAEIRSGSYQNRSEDAAPESLPEFAVDLDLLGLVLVPDVVPRTPPYIDTVRPGTVAHAAGLQPDDLVIFVNDRLVQSCSDLKRELAGIDRADPVTITVVREQQLIDTTLEAPAVGENR